MPGEKTHGCIHQHSRHSGTRLLLLPNHGDAQQEDAQTCLWCLGLRRVWICPSSTQRQRTVGGFCKCLFGGPAAGWGKSGKKFPAVFSEGRQETCEKESVERAVQVQVMFTSIGFPWRLGRISKRSPKGKAQTEITELLVYGALASQMPNTCWSRERCRFQTQLAG